MMQNVKKVGLVVILFLVGFGLFCAQIEAAAHKPVISGNYEQGWRLYDVEEGSGDDYFFRESWLKWKQNFTSQSYYYVKVRLYETDFAVRNQFDSLTIDLSANYTRQISKPFRIKTEVNLREKNYPLAQSKKYYEVTGNLELSLKPGPQDQVTGTVKLQREIYPMSDKDNLLSGANVNWERKISTRLSVHTGCALTRENYLAKTALTDKMLYSISIGFEYKM